MTRPCKYLVVTEAGPVAVDFEFFFAILSIPSCIYPWVYSRNNCDVYRTLSDDLCESLHFILARYIHIDPFVPQVRVSHDADPRAHCSPAIVVRFSDGRCVDSCLGPLSFPLLVGCTLHSCL